LGVERIVFALNNKGGNNLKSVVTTPKYPPKVSSLGGQYLPPSEDNSILASADLEENENSSDSEQQINKQREKLISIHGNSILASTKPVTFISQEPRDEVIAYTVEEGDTGSSIAASFGISLDTLLWANDLEENSVIKPGDELTILPVSGVMHKVKSSDTISDIADEYDAEEQKIIEFNSLPADGKISIGEELIVPGGEKPEPVAQTPTRTTGRSYSSSDPQRGQGHQFPYGQCTWYVSQKRYVPWSGHAKQWLYNARAMEYSTGQTPQAGAIIVTNESWYGHVGYVEAVKGNWVTFSEMNHIGWAVKSVRTIHKDNYKIRGYIY
jgi:surface antigen